MMLQSSISLFNICTCSHCQTSWQCPGWKSSQKLSSSFTSLLPLAMEESSWWMAAPEMSVCEYTCVWVCVHMCVWQQCWVVGLQTIPVFTHPSLTTFS